MNRTAFVSWAVVTAIFVPLFYMLADIGILPPGRYWAMAVIFAVLIAVVRLTNAGESALDRFAAKLSDKFKR